jgi:uncharacterized protein YacL
MEPQNDPILEKITTRSVGMRYGLFAGGIGIVSFLVTTLSGMNVQDGGGAWLYRLFSTVLTVVILYLAHQYFKQNGDGFMSFGQGFGIGFWCTFTSTLLSSIFVYVYVKFIDSGFIDMIKEAQSEAMRTKGMSEEQIEQSMKYVSMFTTPEMILVFGLVIGLFFGLLIAAVVTIFTQKRNPDAIPV